MASGVLGATISTSVLDMWFWVTSVSAAFCAAISTVVVVAGWRRRLPEVGLLGTGLLLVSLWAFAGGLLSPGPLFGYAAAGSIAVLAGFPAGLIATMPLLAPRARWAQVVARRWHLVAVLTITASIAGIVALLANPGTRFDVPGLRPAIEILIAAGGARLALRQWYLHRIAGTRSSAVASVSIGFLAAVALVAQHTEAASPVAWAGVLADNAGVFAAAIALIVGYRQHRSIERVLAPIMLHDPLGAFEAGLAPEVRAFVAALERKNPITQQHVIRTSAMAMRVAERARLSPERVRSVALGALLHDIGKLVIPSAILDKPAALTDEEYTTIKTHPEQGEALLRRAPGLAKAARIVRGHHERPDGRGYPDGLCGDAIEFDISIVSVCDAWDAMTNTRQYRQGIDVERAHQIIRDGAGLQWHQRAVELLVAEVDQCGPVADPEPLVTVAEGADPILLNELDCACADALPEAATAATFPPAIAGRPSDGLLRMVFDAAPIGMALVCPRGRLVDTNDALATLADRSIESLLGTHFIDLLHVADREAFRAESQRGFADGGIKELIGLRLVRPDATERFLDASLRTMDEPGTGPCLLVQVVDTTEIVRLHRELECLAHTDELTGLRNRRGLFHDARTAFEITSRGAGVAQMVFIDVDGLKAINDGWGHAAGDQSLIIVASAISAAARASDLAARLGGDEFCLLLPDAPPGAALHLSRRLEREIPVAAAEESIPWPLRISTGVATADPDRAPNLPTLLNRADSELYENRAVRHPPMASRTRRV